MKVLLSAYACEPGKGSEPEVGLQVLSAAASQHDVWVLTRTNNVVALEKWLRGQAFGSRVHLVGIDVPGLAFRAKKRGLPGLHWYYDVWQRQARQHARQLEAQIGFDVFHHATFATYWTRPGVADLGKPFVWGPVGGGVPLPMRLIPALGVKGMGEDALRYGARFVLGRSPWVKAAARTASVIFVQNNDGANALPETTAHVSVLPNATSASVQASALTAAGKRTGDVVMVGRIVGWKGAALGVRALAHMRNQATLRIYGEGPDEKRLRRLTARLGLSSRVEFMGRVPRDTLLVAVAEAGCVVHPAIHDDSPLGVAEVLSVGAPLVCLDHGGPAELIRHWPDSPARSIKPGSLRSTVASMAAAVDSFLDDPPLIPSQLYRPKTSFSEKILGAYEIAAKGSARR
jgi:glycosyltransferase involved in cell wall biosynthesis